MWLADVTGLLDVDRVPVFLSSAAWEVADGVEATRGEGADAAAGALRTIWPVRLSSTGGLLDDFEALRGGSGLVEGLARLLVVAAGDTLKYASGSKPAFGVMVAGVSVEAEARSLFPALIGRVSFSRDTPLALADVLMDFLGCSMAAASSLLSCLPDILAVLEPLCLPVAVVLAVADDEVDRTERRAGGAV